MVLLCAASLVMLLGIAAAGAGGCMSLGNLKFKKLGNLFSLGGVAGQILGLVLIYVSYRQVLGSSNVERVEPIFPGGYIVYLILTALLLVSSQNTPARFLSVLYHSILVNQFFFFLERTTVATAITAITTTTITTIITGDTEEEFSAGAWAGADSDEGAASGSELFQPGRILGRERRQR